jgi:NAD(P) transhydrogenase subunit beta
VDPRRDGGRRRDRLYAARTVQMTQMPELVAIMHSLVGLCGVPRRLTRATSTRRLQFTGAEKVVHEIEIYLGILIGA